MMIDDALTRAQEINPKVTRAIKVESVGNIATLGHWFEIGKFQDTMHCATWEEALSKIPVFDKPIFHDVELPDNINSSELSMKYEPKVYNLE
jgi:hypothetical protein